MKELSISTRFTRNVHHPIRPAATAVPLATCQHKLLLILALGLLASIVYPALAHAQDMVHVGYSPAQVVIVQPAPQPTTIQGSNTIQMQIQQQLQSQLDILGGTSETGAPRALVEVGPADARVADQLCDQIDLILPVANRLRGRMRVDVRCRSPHAWTAQVPAIIQITGTYYAASRQLSPGKMLDLGDLEARTSDLSMLPTSVVQQPADVMGHVLLTSVAANQLLRAESLRLPMTVQAGRTIKPVAEGGDFQVGNDGRTLNRTAVGQVAQVRTASGNVVSDIAQSADVVAIQF